MIIDMRLRPPYRGYRDMFIYKPELANPITRGLGMEPAPSSQALSMELCFKEMDEVGITYGVVPGRRGHRLYSVTNDDVIDLVNEHPDRFIGVCGVNAEDVSDALAEIERTVINGPLRGVNMEPGSGKNPIYGDDRRLYPIYDLCAQHDIPVMLMLGGRCGPDMTYSNPSIILHIAMDFPKGKFIISHGGWPWVQQICATWFWTKNIYVQPDMYLYHNAGRLDYIAAANNYLQDNFLFGTAYPYIPIVEGTKQFIEMFDPKVLPKLMYQNAARLFHMDVK